MARKLKITKEIKISEVIQKYPKTTFVFIDYGLHCIGCPMAPDETLEEAARLHHLDLKKLLTDLKKTASKK